MVRLSRRLDKRTAVGKCERRSDKGGSHGGGLLPDGTDESNRALTAGATDLKTLQTRSDGCHTVIVPSYKFCDTLLLITQNIQKK